MMFFMNFTKDFSGNWLIHIISSIA